MKAIPIGLALLAALAFVPACQRDIGDECATSVDCDPNGTRACDLSQPGGFCTIQGCSESSCPSDTACIRLFPVQFLTQACKPNCEDRICRTGACGEADPASCLPECPMECLDGTLGYDPLNACAADELCLDVGQCARRSLEMRYCANTCGDNGDCRSGYQCRETGGGDGSMALTPTPGQKVRYCAPAPKTP